MLQSVDSPLSDASSGNAKTSENNSKRCNQKERKDAEDNEFSASTADYKDLLEENKYLRLERIQLYDQIACPPVVETKCDCASLIQTLRDQILDVKCNNEELLAHIMSLESDNVQLMYHGTEQATVAKDLEQKLSKSEESLHFANAEVLQILPLRIKLKDLRQKTDVISGDILAANNEISAISHERDKLKALLITVRKSLEDSKIKLDVANKKLHTVTETQEDLLEELHNLKEKITGSVKIVESQAQILKDQEEKLAELTIDSAHWERKSNSLSKELSRMKEENTIFQSKLELREEAMRSMVQQSRLTIASSRKIQKKPYATETCWSLEAPQTTVPLSSLGQNSIFNNEDMKSVIDQSDQDDETFNYDINEDDDRGCTSMCENFSFVSSPRTRKSRDRRRSSSASGKSFYGKI